MAVDVSDSSRELLCHRCGYDVRAQPEDGRCPECEFPVAESRQWALIPRRPAWRDSDPRWRRRLLAGLWILSLLPVLELTRYLGWWNLIPIPTVIDYRGTVTTLDHTLAAFASLALHIWACIGFVLLFAREQGRQRNRLDWVPRWGVLCCYVVLGLVVVSFLPVCALVAAGIAALLMSIPPPYQPPGTYWLAEISCWYLWLGVGFGPYVGVVCASFASAAALLACGPLANALRSSVPRWVMGWWLAPLVVLALASLTQLVHFSARWTGITVLNMRDPYEYQTYFRPRFVVSEVVKVFMGGPPSGLLSFELFLEAIKWLAVLSIALWLTLAQLHSWRRRSL